jgi:hypothetical protein
LREAAALALFLLTAKLFSELREVAAALLLLTAELFCKLREAAAAALLLLTVELSLFGL